MSEEAIDFSEDIKGGSVDLSEGKAIVAEYAAKKAEVADLEAKLKEAKKDAQQLLEIDLVQFLERSGLSEFKTDDGLAVQKGESFSCNIPAKTTIERAKSEDERAVLIERKEAAFAWLKDNGGEDIIKNILGVDVGKDVELGDQVREALADLPYYEDRSVAPQTLSAFLKEKLEAGDEVPESIFNLSRFTTATVKNGRKKV